MAGGNVQWTSAEIAFLLNYTDVCLKNRTIYRDTVSKELAKFTERAATLKSIENKLYRLLAVNAPKQPASVTTLYQEGTKHLTIQKLSEPVLKEMKLQRHILDLGDLDGKDFPESKATLDYTSSTAADVGVDASSITPFWLTWNSCLRESIGMPVRMALVALERHMASKLCPSQRNLSTRTLQMATSTRSSSLRNKREAW
jgi:hypothetical protein